MNRDLYGDLIEEPTKKCNCCKEILPLSSFGNDSGGNKLRSWCKECDRKSARELKRIRDSVPKPDSDHTCPICGKGEEEILDEVHHQNRKVSPWVCDHDHDSKSFRGWLCRKCNLGLGNFDDNIDHLISAIKYLKSSSK